MSNVVQMRPHEPHEAMRDSAPAGYEDMPLYMSPAQLSAILEVSVVSLARWRKEKPLRGPAYSLFPGTRLVRYARPDVLAWIESCKVDAS